MKDQFTFKTEKMFIEDEIMLAKSIKTLKGQISNKCIGQLLSITKNVELISTERL